MRSLKGSMRIIIDGILHEVGAYAIYGCDKSKFETWYEKFQWCEAGEDEMKEISSKKL